MLLERFEVEGLAHYSYAVGCPQAGAIAIVDPERNIERYLEFAEREGVRIAHVLETHIHADYASGARALVERTGAELHVSAYDVGETYEVGFAHRDMAEGDVIEIGPVRIVALHTPGHTPEHLSFLVYDTVLSREIPQLMLSGDFLFVGSLGRPDLLGADQKLMLAKRLYSSVRDKLADLPDSLEIYPAHGAGSLCGAGLSGRPTSTLGFERATNPYLDPELDEQAFVDRILGNVPPFPPYYLRMKQLNSDGAEAFEPRVEALSPAAFEARMKDGHEVVDLRDRNPYAGAHIPGSIASDPGASLVVWASWLVPADKPLLLIARDAEEAIDAARVFARVGLDRTVAFLEGGMRAWQEAGLPVAQMRWFQFDPAVPAIDVRSASEFEEGHVEGARHIFLGELPDRLDELPPRHQPVALICRTGDRSTVAASVLERAGFTDVQNIAGGMTALKKNS